MRSALFVDCIRCHGVQLRHVFSGYQHLIISDGTCLIIAFLITNMLDCSILWGASMWAMCSTTPSVSRCLPRHHFVELFHFSVYPLQRDPFQSLSGQQLGNITPPGHNPSRLFRTSIETRTGNPK